MAEVYMAGDFRNGTTFEMEGNVFRVVEFQHVKPGKGSAFVRTKLKNVITGAVLEKTFNPSDKFPGAEIEKKEMQYLYNDGDLYYFMDNVTYDQIPLNKEQLGDCLKYLKENMVITDEPGIYIPGKFGIRIEDTLLVTKKGAIALTESNKECIILSV